ncbi:hypothetical protein [Undibacterium sp. Tian12W]
MNLKADLLLSISLILTDIEEISTPAQAYTYFSMHGQNYDLIRKPIPDML